MILLYNVSLLRLYPKHLHEHASLVHHLGLLLVLFQRLKYLFCLLESVPRPLRAPIVVKYYCEIQVNSAVIGVQIYGFLES